MSLWIFTTTKDFSTTVNSTLMASVMYLITLLDILYIFDRLSWIVDGILRFLVVNLRHGYIFPLWFALLNDVPINV